MSKFDEHPTVQRLMQKAASTAHASQRLIQSNALRAFALERGADDCGFVSIDDPTLGEERDHVMHCFPSTRTLMAIVCRMHREQVRSPARSLANLEFHKAGEDVDTIARDVVRHLEDQGIRAVNPAMAFPMELDRSPSRGLRPPTKWWVQTRRDIDFARPDRNRSQHNLWYNGKAPS